jgi:hypothetical protein
MQYFLTSFFLLGVSTSVSGQLAVGDIAFIAFNADGDDDFAIVALVDISANTQIYFSDNEPTSGAAMNSGEGCILWDSGLGIVSAGTVVTYTDVSSVSRSSSIGTFIGSDGSLNLAAGGDALFAYHGTTHDLPTVFLAGIQNASGNQGSNLPATGLTPGSSFVTFNNSGSPDGGEYNGPRAGEALFSDYLIYIGNPSNWSTQTSDGELILPIDNTVFTITGGSCTISDIDLTIVGCNDNGTPLDPSDDYLEFTLEPAGTGISGQYTVTSSQGTLSSSIGNEGSTEAFSLTSSIGINGNISITVDFGGCSYSDDILAATAEACLGSSCGSESFTNSTAGSSYGNNNYLGDTGVTWTYVQARDEYTTPITGAGLMLRGSTYNSSLTSSTLSGGIGSFSCKLLKGYTGAGNRRVELYVNGFLVGTSVSWDNTTVQDFEVTDINVAGNVVIELRTATNRQVVIDDISWTCNTIIYPYFQSNNGLVPDNWSNPTMWQRSADESTWVSTPFYPSKSNAEQITIQSNHYVTADLSLNVPVVIIEEFATLETISTESLNFVNTDTGGPELIINGVWKDNGVSPNNTVFTLGAEWVIASSSNASIIKTGNGSVNNYKNNYDGGINNMPMCTNPLQCPNWIFEFADNGIVASTAINMVYPNLTYRSATVDHVFGSSTEWLNGNSGTAVINGDFTIGGGSANVSVVNNNTNGVPILIKGDLTISAGDTLRNFGGSSFGTGFEVKGNLSINGTLNLSGGSNQSVGQLLLTGSSIQYAEGAVGAATDVRVNRLQMNNALGSSWSELDVEVHYQMDLTDGIIDMDNPSLIHLTSTATSGAGSASSFINGRVRKTGLPISEFVFPVGDLASGIHYYQPASLESTIGLDPSADYEVQYYRDNFNVNTNYPNAAYDGNWFFFPPIKASSSITNVSTCDYWDIVQNVAGSVLLGLTWTEATTGCVDVVDPTLLRLAHFDDGEPGGLPELWEDATVSGLCTTISGPSPYTTGWVRTDNPVSTFSPFTLAQVGDPFTNVLPIELLSFSASPKEHHVLTEWITASEVNNDFFIVERSLNAIDYEALGYVTGAGNSSEQLSYSFEDRDPLRGLSYYRLTQTDYDGTTSTSDPVAVEYGIDSAFDIITTYSQSDVLVLEFRSNKSILDLRLYDLLGQLVYQEQLQDPHGRAEIMSQLPEGAYILTLSDGERQVQRKVFW